MKNVTKEFLSSFQLGTAAGILLEDLKERRLSGRKRHVEDEQLDFLHRKLVLSHPILKNKLYRKLLDADLTDQQYHIFLNSYYHDSVKGFTSRVLPAARKASKDPRWRQYIDAIIIEESTPISHHLLFLDYLKAIGHQTETEAPRIFTPLMVDGYSRNLHFSAGYALGIEIEADFEIAVISLAMGRKFPSETLQSKWFSVHLDESGEEEHARLTIDMICSLIQSDEDKDEVKKGLLQSWDDNDHYLNQLHDLLSKI